MSDPKLVSPLLDGFALGTPISSHDGVRCCPAIKENSDKKYIVKIITIPATQTQMDALLLAGAYKDPADAMAYYSVIGEEVMKEAELLTTLSKLDGFLPYEGWQMEPITKRRLGYEVYLIGSYKRSLEKYVRRNPVTHLEAVNLALDMCSALAVCRQAGALYVDLKPQNIFISDKKEYRIGDLGFVSMDALSYTALPDKYRSQYTPPELFDPMASLNLTVDTYAVGMILYQLYNDGQLPFRITQSEEGLPTPMNADYELAEIIMKAIHIDPAQRWKDPQEMGRALVDYMQRNAVNDVPITPHTPLEAKPEAVIVTQTDNESISQPELSVNTAPEQTETAEEPVCQAADESQTETENAEPVPSSQLDETLPSEADAESVMLHEISDELSRIIAKADDLLSHEIPEDIILAELPKPKDPFAFVATNPEDVDDSDVPLDPIMEESLPEKPQKPVKSFASGEGRRKVKKALSTLGLFLALAGLAAGGLWGYKNYYVQTIDSLVITGDQNNLTVSVGTLVDESLLSVICSDNYGNVLTEKLVNGNASFTDLLPNTMYKIQVEIDGFHTLVGETSNVFTTEATTRILGFSAVTGAEDGSVLLNFTSDGEEPTMWTLVYQAEGEEEQRKNFDGHSVSLTGLSIGKVYTFTLEAGNQIPLSGEKSITYMASRLILAQDLTVNSANENEISVTWRSPGDIVVESWTVRCYSSNTDEQFTVSEPEAYFTGIDPNISYTVEVTAAGMTQPSRISISEDPISITAIHTDDSKQGELNLSWEHTGTAPEGGWLVLYTIDGVNSAQNVIKCEDASAVIRPLVPEADYHFSLQAADNTTVFGGYQDYSTLAAPAFSENGLEMNEVTGNLVKTPDQEDWLFDDLGKDAFATKFNIGDPISVVLYGKDSFYMPGTATEILFVIRDGYGNVIPQLVAISHDTWRNLWYPGDDHYAELDIPRVPENPGDYTVTVFFNGAQITSLAFSIS